MSRSASLLVGIVTPGLVMLAACTTASPSPAQSASPSLSASPSSTVGASASPTATVVLPLSLALPTAHDVREVQFAVSIKVPDTAGGVITVRVKNLSPTRVTELVLRWPTDLGRTLYLAPFTTHSIAGALVLPWTKWVEGPGESGEPAGTISLGYGPLDPGATLSIPLYATRRVSGPVAFDLQLLAGEVLLSTRGGLPATTRVSVP